MKKRYVIIAIAILVLAVVVAGVIVLASAGVLPNPFHKEISREAASAKAAAYILQRHPEMRGAKVYTNQGDDLPYWEFGYRKDETTTLDGESIIVPRIIIITISKESGDLRAAISD
jgi:hypothetical protein